MPPTLAGERKADVAGKLPDYSLTNRATVVYHSERQMYRRFEIGDSMNEKLYVVGHPVAHSKSPAMHNAAYKALGLQWEYDFMDCASEADARSFLSARDWRAINITMPWKPLAYEIADKRSEEADLAQGANALVNWEGELHADNTDGKGCVAYLKRCGAQFEGARVAVCGTGPTSLAIMHACAKAGAAHVSLFSRNVERARKAIDGYKSRLGDCVYEAEFAAQAYDAAGNRAIAAAEIVIDATSLGMTPGDPAPFDTSVLAPGRIVFDVVYGHGETALISAARHAGCAAYDGSGMLVAQAVETVRDISDITGAFAIPAHLDLFAIMAEAAGFEGKGNV